MEKMKIRELTLGEFFRLSDSENAPVWVRGEYNRSTRNTSATNTTTLTTGVSSAANVLYLPQTIEPKRIPTWGFAQKPKTIEI